MTREEMTWREVTWGEVTWQELAQGMVQVTAQGLPNTGVTSLWSVSQSRALSGQDRRSRPPGSPASFEGCCPLSIPGRLRDQPEARMDQRCARPG